MRDRDKDRNAEKAWRRARNDASTALRKLTEAAESQGATRQAAEMTALRERVAELAADILGGLDSSH